jgi:DNA-directed RNA polymerase subunit D
MQTIQNTNEQLVLRMDANEPLANAIRRSLSDIPTLAIDDVEIYKNDSALYDEVVANRLGLIPLKTEKSMSGKTKIDLKLSKKGPGSVYAGDLQGSATVVQPKIPVTLLGDNHKLELVATAILGTGKEHAKHVPGLCYYRHLLEVKSTPAIDKLVEKSKGLIKPEKKGGKWVCDLNEAVINDVEKADRNAISDSNEMIFVIESYGNMPAKDILSEAVKALEKNLDEFEKGMK